MPSADGPVRNSTYIFHGARVLNRPRRNFTSAVISASDICAPKGGIDRPSSGEIQFDGKRVDDLSESRLAAFRAGSIGFIFQPIRYRNVPLSVICC